MKFLILTNPRTGTHLLQTALKNHSQLKVNENRMSNGNKWFRNQMRKRSITEIFNRCMEGYDGMIIHREELTEELKRHINRSRILILSLTRDNMLEQYISNELAFKHRKWIYHKNDISEPHKKINVDIGEFEYFMDRCLKLNEGCKKSFRESVVFELTYEELVRDYKDKIREVQNFLNVPFEDIYPETKKYETRKKQDIILNYREIWLYLKSKGKEKWLN